MKISLFAMISAIQPSYDSSSTMSSAVLEELGLIYNRKPALETSDVEFARWGSSPIRKALTKGTNVLVSISQPLMLSFYLWFVKDQFTCFYGPLISLTAKSHVQFTLIIIIILMPWEIIICETEGVVSPLVYICLLMRAWLCHLVIVTLT